MAEIDFEPSIDPKITAQILAKLQDIEVDHQVRILFAVESGSRAWGFPSPDSDYDARFVYVRPVDWYLTISPGRDVIELPIVDELDINGWDIKKALGLLMKPNPVLLEWLSSPVRYIWSDEICDELIAFSQRVTHGAACLYHYLHLGERQWSRFVGHHENVRLKKYFYVVRPAMAIRWLRMNPELAPPMNFQELMNGTDIPAGLQSVLLDLLEAKSRSKEIGEAPRIGEIDDFITSELAWAKQTTPPSTKGKPRLANDADALFRSILQRVW